MKITSSDFVISAVSDKQYPTENLPELALAGRSNVGKSSFINRMIQRKNLARTSSKPGKTQTLNFYIINELFYFVDVPGYGFAKVSKQERESWGNMIESYLLNREQLKVVLLVVDLRHDPTKDDILMYDFLKHYGIPCIVIATKADKITKGKRQKHLSNVRKSLQLVQDDEIIMFSAETGEGKDKTWELISQYL